MNLPFISTLIHPPQFIGNANSWKYGNDLLQILLNIFTGIILVGSKRVSTILESLSNLELMRCTSAFY